MPEALALPAAAPIAADHNLLVGVLALQLDFVARDELIDAACEALSDGQSQPLLEVLRARTLIPTTSATCSPRSSAATSLATTTTRSKASPTATATAKSAHAS